MRSLRYILRMVVLLGIVFAVMAAAGLLDTGDGNLLNALFNSRNGWLLLGVLVILAGVYPGLAFGETRVRGDIEADRDKIRRVMENYGFVLSSEDGKTMVFRAAKLSRRIASQFDDTVTVTGLNGVLFVEGMKKDIYRIDGRLRHELDGEE